MKILKMTASFGSLQKQELILQDGLNVFCLPNEAGKSTWSVFLLCMLYGVDTAERATKTNLPAKTRYKPWWGGSMEGRMELEWNGRHIAIERTSTARAPMSQFRAWDLDSGEKIPELTADNCGQVLLGAERSVFVRSAFLGQRALAVTADAALEKRLSALVTSGDERVSAAETQKRLKDAKNRIRHNKTGLLPQAEQELEECRRTLAQLENLMEESAQARAQEQALAGRQQTLEAQIDGAERYQAAKRFEKKRAQEAALEEKTRAADALLLRAKQFPKPEVLQTLQADLQTLKTRRAALLEGPKTQPQRPEKPVCPPVFQALSAEQILPRAEQDAARTEALTKSPKAPAALQFAVGGILLLAAILVFALAKNMGLTILNAAPALLCIWAGIRSVRKNRVREEQLREAAVLRAQYENREPGQFVSFAADYHTALLLYEQALASYEAEYQTWEAAQQAEADEKSACAELRGRILGAVCAFAPGTTGEDAALAAILHAQEAWAQYDAAVREQAHAKAALDAVTQAFEGSAAPEVPAGDWEQFDLPAAKKELSDCAYRRLQLQSRLDRSRGQMQALGDFAALSARQEALETRIQTLEEKEAALSIALSSLEDASQALQTRFAPKLTALAGTIFAELTGARYDKLTLDREMNLSAGEAGEVALRQAMALSGGTVDQLYLALRLAIVELALPEDAPIVLDDALAMFDDVRAARALHVLQKLSGTRQILLFSCHSREKTMLN